MASVAKDHGRALIIVQKLMVAHSDKPAAHWETPDGGRELALVAAYEGVKVSSLEAEIGRLALDDLIDQETHFQMHVLENYDQPLPPRLKALVSRKERRRPQRKLSEELMLLDIYTTSDGSSDGVPARQAER